tara:strand:+ start:845 stop:1150 length:306 start_codon:yes stop_codon:yes gene_type:complete
MGFFGKKNGLSPAEQKMIQNLKHVGTSHADVNDGSDAADLAFAQAVATGQPVAPAQSKKAAPHAVIKKDSKAEKKGDWAEAEKVAINNSGSGIVNKFNIRI